MAWKSVVIIPAALILVLLNDDLVSWQLIQFNEPLLADTSLSTLLLRTISRELGVNCEFVIVELNKYKS